MQTIEFKTKKQAEKRADLLKNSYKTTKIRKTANNMYVVIFNYSHPSEQKIQVVTSKKNI